MEFPFDKPKESNYIKARCVVEGLNPGIDIWPDEFRAVPKEGDTIESDQGRRLNVLRVVHLAGPVLQLELGRESVSDVTPTEGGSPGIEID